MMNSLADRDWQPSSGDDESVLREEFAVHTAVHRDTSDANIACHWRRLQKIHIDEAVFVLHER